MVSLAGAHHTSSGTARNRVQVVWSSCYNLCKALRIAHSAAQWQQVLSSAAAAWGTCACARTREIKMSTSARSQSLKGWRLMISLAHLSSCTIDDDFDHQDSKTRWCLLVLSQLYKSLAEGNCEDIQRHLSRPWNCLGLSGRSAAQPL